MVGYIPCRRDIVWLDFNPQQGKEITKTRPALVISPELYNAKTGLALFMPITSKIKNYPFECIIHNNKIQGTVLCDQIRSLDWRAGKAQYITRISIDEWTEIIGKFNTLLSNY